MAADSKERVFLERQHWQRLHPPIRRAVNKAIDRVRALRAEILSAARVAELPPVFVLDHAWAFPGKPPDVVGGAAIVHGASTIVEIDGEYEYGVQLPAPVIIHSSQDLLRGMLLHEFAHCFFSMREILKAFDRGETHIKERLDDPSQLFNREWDSARLDPPALWFSERDVGAFLYQHDAMLGPCSDLIRSEWIARKLPTIAPSLRYSIRGTFTIPPSILERLRSDAAV
jgi:hypothetical protein